MCGHSLEVNVTSSLDFYLSIAQVQLLQQLLRDNMVGTDTPEKSGEVNTVYKHIWAHALTKATYMTMYYKTRKTLFGHRNSICFLCIKAFTHKPAESYVTKCTAFSI